MMNAEQYTPVFGIDLIIHCSHLMCTLAVPPKYRILIAHKIVHAVCFRFEYIDALARALGGPFTLTFGVRWDSG